MKNKWFSFLIKVIILLLLLYATYLQLFQHNGKFENLNQSIINVNWNSKSILILFAVVFLMLCNWLVEAFKWKYLLKSTENLKFRNAIKAIFSGVTLSLFTPNRIGEYGGRILFVKKQNRAEAITTTVLCSLSQQIAIIFFGVLAYAILKFRLNTLHATYFYLVVFASVFYLITIVAIYFNANFVKEKLRNIKFVKKWLKSFENSKTYKTKALSNVLLFSILRYFIFVTQLYLLLVFFGVNVNFVNAYILVAILFLFQTLIPSIALVELGIRGNIAVGLFKLLGIYSFGIVNAILLLWIVNLLLPALIGWLIILKTKLIEK